MEFNKARNSALASFRESTKELLGFLAALSLTNAVSQFVVKQQEVQNNAVFPADTGLWLATAILVIFVIRYFIGNVAYLNNDQDNDRFEVVFDSIVVISEALILCYAGSFVGNPQKLYAIICVLLVVDLLWWMLAKIIAAARKKKSDVTMDVNFSQILSVLTLTPILYFAWEGSIGEALGVLVKGPVIIDAKIAASILMINCAIDFFINGPRYVGVKWRLVRDDKEGEEK